MRSTARFLEGTLLGVALGVGLGFLVFRKSNLKSLRDLWLTTSQPVLPQGATAPPRFGGGVVEAPVRQVEPSEYELAAAGLISESEVQISPEVLEEPLGGAAWVASPVQEEEVTEKIMPTLPSEMEAYTSVEVEPLDVEGIPVWAEIPSPEVEVEPDAEAAVEELQAEDLMVQDMAVEEAAVEEPLAEETAVEETAVEETAVEETTAEETLEVEETVEEVEIEAAPVPTPADDLKARIEETRRRIRRELEQPFIIGGEAAAAEAALSTGAEPEIGEALAVEPSPEDQPISETQETPVSTVGETEVAVTAEGEESSSAAEGAAVDYDAMRSRIEETRSRLKAKAFDAMMTGESALLGRDPEDAGITLPAPTEVDGEIVQTIDETLREEET